LNIDNAGLIIETSMSTFFCPHFYRSGFSHGSV